MHGERIVCSIQQRFKPCEAAIFAISATDHSRPSILLIDDDADERHFLTDLLRRQRYQVATAADGQHGYQQALARRPNLILLDVCMPGLDGFGACRLLKANPATAPVPVIFLSALDDPDERVAGLVLGGADYMSKPYHPPEVFARVRIHLDLARGAGQFAPAALDAGACPGSMHPDEVLVCASKNLIASNLAASLSLAQIASAVGTYEKRLSAAFRLYAGMSVFAYLGEQRIARGLQLLAETDMSVHEIAAQTGFNNAGNFATAFRSRTGVTPTSYRQALRADAQGASR